MTAPLDPRRARSRRKLVDAAIELLLSGGTSAVTVEAVTHLSGVARTTLYRNFTSSQSLVAAAFDELVPRAVVTPTGTPRERLLDLLHSQYALLLSAPFQDSLVAWLAMGQAPESEGDDELGELRRAVVDRYLEPLHDILDTAVADGSLRGADRTSAIARIVGPPVVGRLIGQPPLSEADLDRVVTDVLGPPG